MWTEAIAVARSIIPIDVECRWHFRDPIFSGLHHFTDTFDGRSYRDTAHTCYPWHIDGPADRRLTTIVFPRSPTNTMYDVHTAVHEMGHVIDYAYGFSRICTPVSSYAESNRSEAFAEAVTSYLIDGYGDWPLAPDDYEWMAKTLAAA